MTPECEATMSEQTHCLGLTIFHNKAFLLKGTFYILVRMLLISLQTGT